MSIGNLTSKQSPLVVTKGGVPFADQAEGVRQFKEACLTAETVPQKLERLTAENKALREALQQLLTRYVELVNSGDAGNWNPETELEVIDARKALGEQP